MRSLPVYILFLALPFWHVRLAEYISVYEVGMLAAMLLLPFSKVAWNRLRWGWLDIVIFLFAGFGVLEVATSTHAFYESMRVYRYLILGPVLIYYLVRVIQPNALQLERAMILFSLVVAGQALPVLHYVGITGSRPAGYEWYVYEYQSFVPSIVTFSVLAVMAATASLSIARKSGGWKRLFTGLAGLLCVAGIIASASRAAALAFFVFFPLSGWMLRNRGPRVLLVTGAYTMIVTMLVLVFFVAMTKQEVEAGGGGVEGQRDIGRIVNIEEYKEDIFGRLDFWAQLTRSGFSTAILGKGLATFDVGNEQGVKFTVGSAHNMLVGAFYTTGIPGLLFALLFWHASITGVARLRETDKPDWRARFLMVGVMTLLLVSMTNDLTAGRGNLLMFMMAILAGGAGIDTVRGAGVNRPVARQQNSSIVSPAGELDIVSPAGGRSRIIGS